MLNPLSLNTTISFFMIALSNTIILYQFEISRCFLDRSNKKTESLLNSVHHSIHSLTLISIKGRNKKFLPLLCSVFRLQHKMESILIFICPLCILQNRRNQRMESSDDLLVHLLSLDTILLLLRE